ncbi:metallophosphoesterase family protein [Limnoglobus roseus]|uniref:Serine/threonine protein phosphatase n=1 Tax=Limnoglobus roseus TaxID=2598579 RepID=A0A5C1A4L6_9BACT|nr:metallophosphoesterase family protein [Limnoglobus roseus]QEL13273.1 serine/threonine protein phosphatase [Limnoglobus roseus]
MRTLAIGDIHGCSAMLDDLLRAVKPTPQDQVVFLGDYVDRGPDSRGVIDRVLALRQTHNVVCLRGNHELMMSRARRDKSEYKMWTSVGGMQALGSYGKSPGRAGTVNDIPTEHWRFIEEECINYYETDMHIFVHAGVASELPMDEQDEMWLFWEFLNPTFPPAHRSGKVVICGHSSQRSGEILDCESAICVDTYAYGGGWLSCLDVDSRRYWQVNLIGQVRTGVLGHPR